MADLAPATVYPEWADYVAGLEARLKVMDENTLLLRALEARVVALEEKKK